MSIGVVRPGPVRTAAGLLYASMHVRRGSLPRPIDETVVRVGEGSPLRLLLVADGITHGWGVRSHRDAATGRLAETVAELIGAACEVEFVGDAVMDAATASMWVEGRADASFHGAVVAIGSNDALRLTPIARWEACLAVLLDAVRDRLPANAPILVVGVPDVHVPRDVRRMAAPFRHHARRLDEATRRLVEGRHAVRFLPAPDLGGCVGTTAGSTLAAAFAQPVGTAVVETLGTIDPTDAARVESFEHRDVQTVVEAARADELQALEDLVQRARTRFGVAETAVTLVDGDRTWHIAHTGNSPRQVPRALAYCPIVTETDAPVVISNAKRDPRFADNALLELEHARFYAGAPVHGADGTAIGAFCLFNAFPRSEDRVDIEALQAFALEAEGLIQRVAAARQVPDEVAEVG